MPLSFEKLQWNVNALAGASLLPFHLFHAGHYVFSSALMDGEDADSPFVHDDALLPAILRPDMEAALTPDPDLPMVFYGVVRLSEEYLCVIGPCASLPVSSYVNNRYITQHRMTDYGGNPISIVSPGRIGSVIHVMLCMCQLQDVEVRNIATPVEAKEEEQIDTHHIQSYFLAKNDEQFHHHSYRMEQLLYGSIERGDEEQMVRCLKQFPLESIGTMSRSAEKQSEYLAVLCVSLAARAAIEGGLASNMAYSINDLYLQRISEARTTEQYFNIVYAAFHHLVTAVKEAKHIQKNSAHVEKAKQYIAEHLNAAFTLTDLSAFVHVTPSHLSRLFKKHEQITISEYTQACRVETAKNMLRHTDYSVARIATYLCFSSHSHFSSVFRKIAGQTPSAYREQMHILEG